MTASRREALKAFGVLTAAVTAGLPAKGAAGAVKPDAASSLRWLGDLDGARFAGCLVHDVSEVREGGVAVTFSDALGEFFVVDVLRHDEAAPGVARAGSLDVFLHGAKPTEQGTRPTPEPHGLAAMALAAEIARREAAGAAFPALMTLGERATSRPR